LVFYFSLDRLDGPHNGLRPYIALFGKLPGVIFVFLQVSLDKPLVFRTSLEKGVYYNRK
jgi:hypothetical protein